MALGPAPEPGRNHGGHWGCPGLWVGAGGRQKVGLTHLQDLDLGRVRGSDVEALQVGLEHTLARERRPRGAPSQPKRASFPELPSSPDPRRRLPPAAALSSHLPLRRDRVFPLWVFLPQRLSGSWPCSSSCAWGLPFPTLRPAKASPSCRPRGRPHPQAPLPRPPRRTCSPGA